MPTSIKVNYEDLVNAYWKNLTTVLRGFNVGPGLEFLATWVPEDDVQRSLLSVFEAAQDAGIESITLTIGADTLRKIDPGETCRQAEASGNVRIEYKGAQLELSLTFVHPTSKTIRDGDAFETSPSAPTFRSAGMARTNKHSARENAKCNVGGSLPPEYIASLNKAVNTFPHERKLAPEPEFELVSCSESGVELIALVARNHSIKYISFQTEVSDDRRHLLELLCQLIEGRPIQDASDHAAMYLEYRLRGRNGHRHLPGIVMPENVAAAFHLPVRLVRGLLETYRGRTGYQQTQNFYDAPPSLQWRRLSEHDRINMIQKAINDHPEGQGIQVVRLEGLQRFIIECIGNSSRTGSSLLNLEKHVKVSVEPTLHLYLKPRVDQNKLRRLNEKTTQIQSP